MKATIDVPDELYRQVKAKSALEGRAIREVAAELFERYVRGDLPAQAGTSAAGRPGPAEGTPAWVGVARRFGARPAADGWDAVRASVERGWAEEVAEGDGGENERR